MRTFFLIPLLVSLTGCDPEGQDSALGELSEGERYLVGVWRGEPIGDEVRYFVLNADRTGCEWRRDGDDFAHRYQEFQFFNWQLHEADPDENGWLELTLENSEGEVHDDDWYDPEQDRLLPSGFTNIALNWQSIQILCEDSGTDAIATDVERKGSPIDPTNADNDPDGQPPGQPSGPN